MVRESLSGILITLFGGILWGFSGVCGQYLFAQSVSADWLVPYRLLIAGLILIVFYALKSPCIVLLPILDARLLPQMLIYAILGLMMTQYSYFYSIELSNAAVATTIQYTAPTFILAIVCFNERRLPRLTELVALILAMFGVIMLATHGDLTTLVISKEALFWCLVSAVCVCIYNFAPTKLNSKYPVPLVLGWGMAIGGVVLCVFMRVWQLDGASSTSQWAAFWAVITLGTIFAFSFYMLGVKLIGASKASLIACVEPLSAAFFAYFWLETEFVFLDFVGFVLIMCCIFLLAKKEK
nr:EamA family transporter [Campylobacter anatolicus]